MEGRSTLLALLVLALTSGCARSGGPPPIGAAPVPAVGGSGGAGFFSTEQAERGRQSFQKTCLECHAVSEFRGPDFEWRWRRQTAWALYTEISWNMPEDMPGSLPPETYADIVAFILEINEYASGDTELKATPEAMATIPLGPGAAKTKDIGVSP